MVQSKIAIVEVGLPGAAQVPVVLLYFSLDFSIGLKFDEVLLVIPQLRQASATGGFNYR